MCVSFAVCVHGTYRRNLDSILESGLKRMKRLHVHFSSGLPMDGEVISGKIIIIVVTLFTNNSNYGLWKFILFFGYRYEKRCECSHLSRRKESFGRY